MSVLLPMKTKFSLFLFAAGILVASQSGFAATVAENWSTHCKKCHGEDGSGQTKMGKKLNLPDYTDPAVQAKLVDAEMTRAIKEGVKDEKGKDAMPAYAEKLTDPEIAELVAFVRSMKKG